MRNRRGPGFFPAREGAGSSRGRIRAPQKTCPLGSSAEASALRVRLFRSAHERSAIAREWSLRDLNME
jgi:hypothetical protein